MGLIECFVNSLMRMPELLQKECFSLQVFILILFALTAACGLGFYFFFFSFCVWAREFEPVKVQRKVEFVLYQSLDGVGFPKGSDQC